MTTRKYTAIDLIALLCKLLLPVLDAISAESNWQYCQLADAANPSQPQPTEDVESENDGYPEPCQGEPVANHPGIDPMPGDPVPEPVKPLPSPDPEEEADGSPDPGIMLYRKAGKSYRPVVDLFAGPIYRRERRGKVWRYSLVTKEERRAA